ncbi:1,4-dihydroxy-2-naphthoate polyprenyltransferase [Magnetospirillum sulfuroxidans]|uniref:1,4-dihydroxy-2-naphthoate octaprenyltransferase n=1 Tax=Magnetospirillum sulfuroxidans TaxID=611300 RepID=A0ABS5ID78_9PROT|nr:1,4-dihydroxy-2-naphthoate polyprenyltransferase [Magnetospirillum sulfuroxidans]MBR9971643.1 1,4-dihydroxy-2-naphthoate polyprenyltransferase [Magnetospirillum sulfuroxidans]
MNVESGPPKGSAPRVEEPPPSSRADEPPTGWRLWLAAMRPRTLTIAVAPVIAGAGWAWTEFHAFRPIPLLVALLAAVLIQAGTNLWNDLGDALRGGDQPLRQGPPRVTALGWASPERVRRAAQLCFAAAALAGLYLGWVGGWPILALGAASLVAGWAYSGGPRPIAYTAVGEVFVIAFFGIGAVAGTVWLQAEAISARTVLLGLAIGLPAAAVLMANNFRDLEHDRMVGRRTLAIRLGGAGSKMAYAALVLLPFPLLLSPMMPVGAWLCLLAAPMAVRLLLAFAVTPRGPAFNAILAGTARFQVLLAVLLALGIVW